MPRFTMPRDVYYGRGSIELLSKLRGKRVVLLTAGMAMKQQGFLARAEAALGRTGMEVQTLETAWPDKAEQAIDEGARFMRGFAPDWIVALGSAAIDAGKLMWILYEYPEAKLGDLSVPFSLPDLRRKARFAAAPALDGGAQEATAFAEIGGTAEQSAWSVVDYEIVPDILLTDPELSMAASPAAVAEGGMEALTHAIAAYAARQSTVFTQPQAQQAAALLFKHLAQAQAGDAEAREQVLYAQTLSGIALSNTLTGLTHALARQTAAAFPACRTRQGALHAVFLPHVLAFDAQDAEVCAQYACLARALGFKGRSDAQAVQALAEETVLLRETLSLPDALTGFGITAPAFERHARTVAARAAADFFASANPRAVSEQGALQLLRHAFGEKEA